MKRARIIWCWAILFVASVSMAPCTPGGGIFIPRNGGYEGFMGKSHVFIDAVSGGALEIVNGDWPCYDTLVWPARQKFDSTAIGAPSYYRWPTYLPQAFPGTFSGKYLEALRYQREEIDFLWLDKMPSGEVNPTFTALLRIAVPGGAALVKDYVECENNPVRLAVENGMVFADDQNAFGYVDNEGVYQVRKTGNPMIVTLPADSKRLATKA